MRRMALAVLAVLIGCDVSSRDEGMPPTPPPAVPLADGTAVAQNWQFRNDCPANVSVFVWTDSADGGGRIVPGAVNFVEIRCTIGEDTCFGAWDTTGRLWGSGLERERAAEWCLPCSPGWLPVRTLDCK